LIYSPATGWQLAAGNYLLLVASYCSRQQQINKRASFFFWTN
jgi:hypothetical protein